MQIGHWTYEGEDFDIEEKLGFVYRIRRTSTGRDYIGRKQFWSRRGKNWYESDWASYRGSSKWLLEELDEFGEDDFSFTILAIFETKSGIAVGEATAILCSGSLLKTEQFYNRAAPAIRGKISVPDCDRKAIEEMMRKISE